MCMPADIDAMTLRIEALGLEPELAAKCACLIGDTPVIVEGSVWVFNETGAVLAILPQRKLYDGVEWRWIGSPDVVVVRGKVDVKAQHVGLCTGDRFLARLAPQDPANPEAGLYLLEWLIPPGHLKAEQWTKEVMDRVSSMFTGAGERQPWGYLLYHCGTTGNAYSSMNDGVYFAHMPADPPRRGPARTSRQTINPISE